LEPLAQERLYRVPEEFLQLGEVDHGLDVGNRRKCPVDEGTALPGSLMARPGAGERAGIEAPRTRSAQLAGREAAVVERLQG